MAKLIPSLGELSGSIGNNTFSHNKGGAYVRRRSIPTNPNSTTQQLVRSFLATLSSQWAGLTSTQRAQWNAWAAANPITDPLGAAIQRTGHQAWVGLGVRQKLIGATPATAPPTALAPAGLSTMSAVCALGIIQVTFTPTPLPAGTSVWVWHTPPGSAGTSPNEKQSRLAFVSAAAAASPVTGSAWVIPLAGQVIQVYVATMNRNDGQVSQALRASVVCT